MTCVERVLCRSSKAKTLSQNLNQSKARNYKKNGEDSVVMKILQKPIKG